MLVDLAKARFGICVHYNNHDEPRVTMTMSLMRTTQFLIYSVGCACVYAADEKAEAVIYIYIYIRARSREPYILTRDSMSRVSTSRIAHVQYIYIIYSIFIYIIGIQTAHYIILQLFIPTSYTRIHTLYFTSLSAL